MNKFKKFMLDNFEKINEIIAIYLANSTTKYKSFGRTEEQLINDIVDIIIYTITDKLVFEKNITMELWKRIFIVSIEVFVVEKIRGSNNITIVNSILNTMLIYGFQKMEFQQELKYIWSTQV